jgi:hypothetical protein
MKRKPSILYPEKNVFHKWKKEDFFKQTKVDIFVANNPLLQEIVKEVINATYQSEIWIYTKA